MKVITEIARVSKPSTKEFIDEFVHSRKPVIISNGLDLWKARNWDLQTLKEKVGNKEFSFRTEKGVKNAFFSNMIEQIENSSSKIQAPYLRNMDLLKMFPELRDDVFPNLPYMKDNWRDHWMWPKNWPEHVGKNLVELFISAKGVAFPRLHIDYWGMDGFIVQLHGSKEFVLYSSEDTPYLYPCENNPLVSTMPDFNNPDLSQFPKLSNATQYRFQLNAGEILYNPGWWHTTTTLETSITIIMAYWNKGNFPIFIEEIKRAYSGSNKLKASMRIN